MLPLETVGQIGLGSGTPGTDNKMNMNPKTSDTITQHGVTH